MPVESGRTEFDLGMIFRKFGQLYERTHKMTSEQRSVMNALSQCRTAHLGGHLERCDGCGHERPAYNSCRNTNCPTCQGIERRRWVERRLDELLPVAYFHGIFTLPSSFNTLIMQDPRPIYNLLMRSSADTILEFFRDQDQSLPLVTSVLHTWGQTMSLHPHAHLLITGGGCSLNDGRWVDHNGRFLFDVFELSASFRRRFIKELIRFQRRRQVYSNHDVARAVLRSGSKWVVHCKEPFDGATTVVEYLSRYVYRTAIANSRIVNVTDDGITFSYKDYRDEDESGKPKVKEMTLSPMDFIQRYLQHIPARGTRRIRFYGVLGLKDKKERLEACWNELGPPPVDERAKVKQEIEEEFDDDDSEPDPRACPHCGGMAFQRCGVVPRQLPRPILFRNEKVKRRYDAA